MNEHHDAKNGNQGEAAKASSVARRIGGVISIVLIVAGVAVLLFPIYDDWRMQMAQDKLLREYEAQFGTAVHTTASRDENLEYIEGITENLQEILDGDAQAVDPFRNFEGGRWIEETEPETSAVTQPETEPATQPTQPPQQLTLLGRMTIPKIDVVMPIVDSASQYALDQGLGHIEGTANIGEIGNVGIAGHRGRRYGRLFYRLDELVEGDVIIIDAGGVTYEYIVYKSHIVNPEDTYVLAQSRSKKVLTLVTCDPPGVWERRLIVHAIQKTE